MDVHVLYHNQVTSDVHKLMAALATCFGGCPQDDLDLELEMAIAASLQTAQQVRATSRSASFP